MKPPVNAKIYEGYLATFWLDGDGVLYAIGKNVPRNLDAQKQNYELIKQITGNKKVCLLTDTTKSSAPDKKTREYIEKELPNYFKAMAIISQSVVGEIIPKIFVAINNQPIPIQQFTSEDEAKKWLRQYL